MSTATTQPEVASKDVKALNTSAYQAFDTYYFCLLYCTNDYFHSQATAQANGFGFSKNQARPGFWPQAGAGTKGVCESESRSSTWLVSPCQRP
jgi:hypothetical protein